jgi:hypothetical protein
MPDPKPPSAFSLWLEEALTGWVLPLVGLGLVAAAAGLYWLGLLPDGPTGAALACLVALGVALLLVKPSLSPAVATPLRALTVGVAAAVAVLTVLPAIQAVAPGEPAGLGELAQPGDSLPLPPGLAGRVRVLVHAPLPPGGTPQVDFRIGGGAAPLEGRVERTLSYSRVGRGSRAAVTHDHNEVWVHGEVAAGAGSLRLERLTGPVAGPLQVAVYRAWFPPRLLWLLASLALLAAAAVEARLGKGNGAAVAGMGLAYGLLVGANASPASAVGTSLGAILLGALAGALAGTIAVTLARIGPWRPAPAPRGKGREREA